MKNYQRREVWPGDAYFVCKQVLAQFCIVALLHTVHVLCWFRFNKFPIKKKTQSMPKNEREKRKEKKNKSMHPTMTKDTTKQTIFYYIF